MKIDIDIDVVTVSDYKTIRSLVQKELVLPLYPLINISIQEQEKRIEKLLIKKENNKTYFMVYIILFTSPCARA